MHRTYSAYGSKIHFFLAGSAESANKDDRKNRVDFARKCSREKNLIDVVHKHLEVSDPLVLEARERIHMRSKVKSKPSPDMQLLLKQDVDGNFFGVERRLNSAGFIFFLPAVAATR